MLEFTVLNSLLLMIRINPSAIEEVEQLHDDIHIDTGCSGKHFNNTAVFIGDQGKSDQGDQGVQISPVRSDPSWVSFDHQVKPA